MTKVSFAPMTLLIAWAIGSADGQAQKASLAPMPERHRDQTKEADAGACRVPVRITEEAERQPGGALHQGPVGQHMMAQGHKMAEMPKVEGAHMIHTSQHGGAFFMAPNKLNHLEALYSADCGVRLVFYNIRTEPVRADRFRAFIKVVPDSMDEPEVLRFLSPIQDGEVLGATIGDEVNEPFEIQLHVKFPEAEAPELFNIRVP